MARQIDDDEKLLDDIHEIARSLGRALSMTGMTIVCPAGSKMLDKTIQGMDKAWMDLADKIIKVVVEQ